ncbi:MAG: hypothetical protein R3A52_27110 [Polyangiales bacterium]
MRHDDAPKASPFEGYDVNRHYRTGSASALLDVIRRASVEGADVRASPVIFLGAAARRDPELAAGVRALREGAAATGRPLLDAILREAARPPPRGPARSAEDLDARWSEFFATGDLAPVREVVAVLSWKDWLREHVESLLRERPWTDFLLGAKRRAALAAKLLALGVRVDLDRATVVNALDLDGVILRADLGVDGDKVKALQSALPRPLTGPELMTLAVKNSAMWSLTANGAAHPAVVDALREALPSAEPRARLSLLRVLARVELTRGELDAALSHAEEVLTAEPDEVGARRVRAVARGNIAVRSAWAVLDARGEPADDPSALRERARAQTPDAYRVLAEMRPVDRPGNPQRDGVFMEQNATFRGDRVRGFRWNWDASSQQALADEWVTIPPAHYENPGLWVRFPPEMNLRAPENERVRRGPYVALLARAPDACERCALPEGVHVALRYDGARLPAIDGLFPSPGTTVTVTVWLRESDAALVGAVVRDPTAGDAPPIVRTVFLQGELVPEVEAPAKFIDGSEGVAREPPPG